MKTKMSNAAKIRAALAAGDKPKNISQRLNVPISTVYTVNWKMKKRPKKIGRPKKVLTFNTLKGVADKLQKENDNVAVNFVREELASIERQIDNLHTIASFLAIRLRQMEQNGE